MPVTVDTLMSSSMATALNHALSYSMDKDDRVIVLGQDVASCGGVFRVTDGLLERFGEKRVLNTPLSETLIAGMTAGMAISGLHPVCELQFMGFAFSALDQLINHVSRIRFRTQSKHSAPCVYRVPFGGQINAPEHHADNYESLFCSIPGLRVVCPSSPQAAYDLLNQAIADPDPVVFLEPISLYHTTQDICLETTSFSHKRCHILSEGSDLTIISWGGMHKTLAKALKSYHKSDISCEIIDLVSLNPIDYESIFQSVEKTGRCLIIQEGHAMLSLASELCTTINESLFYKLLAPATRLCAKNTINPPFRYQHTYHPQIEDIHAAVDRLLAFS